MAPLPGLADQLFDDASVLPPRSTPLARALASHLQGRDAAWGPTCGPLVVPASAVQTLREAVGPQDHVRVALLADTGPDGLVAARDAMQDDPWLELDHVQLSLGAGGAVEADTLLGALSFTVPAAVVVAPGPQLLDAVARVAEDGAEHIGAVVGPDSPWRPDSLADLVLACHAHRVGLRLTGAVSRAVRDDDSDGTAHQGLLNLLAAVWAASDDGDHEDVAALLESRDPDILLAVLGGVDARRLRAGLLGVGVADVPDAHHLLATNGLLAD